MKNKFSLNCSYSVALVLLFVLLLSPAKKASAQQRSPYDLAAWIIGAVYYYDTATVNWALKEGGQIDFKRAGMNALENAIYDKKIEMIKFLLHKGASLDSVNQDGMNALQYAEKIGNPEIIQLIKSKMKPGTPIQTDSTRQGRLPDITSPVNPKAYKAGDKVLISRDRGRNWEPGTIKEVSTNARLLAEGISPYLAENMAKTAQAYLDLNFITTLTRQPSWTSFFVGDWDLRMPMAVTERVIDRDVYQVISGAGRRPPIRINADGTYSWVIDKNKVIKGKWIKNVDAPGIILLKGYREVNWLVYNTSDSDNRKIYKTDYIIIADLKGNYLSSHGFRINKK